MRTKNSTSRILADLFERLGLFLPVPVLEGEFNGIYAVKMASSQVSIRRGLVLVERSELKRCASWVDIAMIVEVCMDVHGWKGVMTCFRIQVPFDA